VNAVHSGRDQRDRGEANTLGLVLMAPAALAVAMLILWIGRGTDTHATVQAASSAAAQAAARQRDPVAAQWAAHATAGTMLTSGEHCNGAPSVYVDVSGFRPGGSVAVTVSCVPYTKDLALAGAVPQAVTATASATIDAYRAPRLP
jgi:hypothetical protein